MRHMQLLMESGKQLMREEARDMVQACGAMPMMVSYSCDGTPCKDLALTVDHKDPLSKVKQGSETEQTRRRKGRQAIEVMVQHTFLRYFDAIGDAHSGTIIMEPVPMRFTKDHDAVWAISRKGLFLAREQGHRGISICHYTMDGGLYTGILRRARQEHMLRAVLRKEDTKEAGLVPRDQMLAEWVVGSRCTAHVCHNSLKWGVTTAWPGGTPLKNLWEVFFGLSNNAYLIKKHILAWLALKVQYVPESHLPSPGEATGQWMALGLPADLLETVASEWRLVWSNGFVQVSDKMEGLEDFQRHIADTIISCLSLQHLTESRWLTIGRSCRSLCLAMMFGVSGLVDYILSIPGGNEHHLVGFRKLFVAETMEFNLTCALSSYVSDGVLAEILEDNRAARQVDHWKQVAQEELSYIMSLDDGVCQGLVARGLAGSMNAQKLHDKILHAALITRAFIEEEAFKPACELPWTLGHGSIHDNLLALRLQEEPPEEPTTHKIWTMMKLNTVPMSQMVAGIRLLLECPWSTNTTEQQHASVSMVKRMHPDYVLTTVLLRAGVHALGRLAPRMDKEDRLVKNLKESLLNMDSKNPEKVSGRLMFFKQICQQVKEHYSLLGQVMPLSTYRRICMLHGRRWQALDPVEQAVFEVMAVQYKYDQEEALETAKEEALAALRIARSRATDKEQAKAHSPLTINACKLDETSFARWQTLYNELLGNPSRVKDLRDQAESCPEPLDDKDIEELDLMPITKVVPQKIEKPAWLTWVCRLRHTLKAAVLTFMRPGGGNIHMKLLYCKQNPLEFHGLLLERCDAYRPSNDGRLPGSQELWGLTYNYNWIFHDLVLTTWREGKDFNIQDVVVVLHTSFQFPNKVVSNDDATTLQKVIDHADYPLPPPQQNSSEDLHIHTKKRRKADTEFQGKFQDATGDKASDDEGDEGATGSVLAKLALPEESEDEPMIFVHEDDALIEAAFGEFERERPDHEGLVVVRLRDFQALLRANGDAWQGQVKRRGAAQQWCKDKHLNQTLKATTTIGGEQAKIVADAWADRMQFLYDRDQEGGFTSPEKAAETLAEYTEPVEFAQLMDGAMGRVRTLGEQVRSLKVPM